MSENERWLEQSAKDNHTLEEIERYTERTARECKRQLDPVTTARAAVDALDAAREIAGILRRYITAEAVDRMEIEHLESAERMADMHAAQWQKRALAAEERLRESDPDRPCRGCGHARRWHRPDTACSAHDQDVMDEDREVECNCAGWWEPDTECPYPTEERTRPFRDIAKSVKAGWTPEVTEFAERFGEHLENHMTHAAGDTEAPADVNYAHLCEAGCGRRLAGAARTCSVCRAAPRDYEDDGEPLEIVEDPNVPVGGGMVFPSDPAAFDEFVKLGQQGGAYALGKDYTDAILREYADDARQYIQERVGKFPEEMIREEKARNGYCTCYPEQKGRTADCGVADHREQWAIDNDRVPPRHDPKGQDQ